MPTLPEGIILLLAPFVQLFLSVVAQSRAGTEACPYRRMAGQMLLDW